MQEFKNAIRAAGLEPPDIITPGKLHRFQGIGKRSGNNAGWCKLFEDGLGGVFGDFSSGFDGHWQAKRDTPYTAAERQAFKEQCERDRKQREADEARKHGEAALKAREILQSANGSDPTQHPYALKKAVSFGDKVKRGQWPQRGWMDALLTPIFDANGKIWTLEAINTDGEKDFLKGGKKCGCFHPLGKIGGAKRVYIGEGLATVAAAHAVDNTPAAAAMDAGNLLAVAEAVRKLAPDAEIILLADNDIKPDSDNNTGVKAATQAAQAVGGRVAIPKLDGQQCDFWDLWKQRGADAVREALNPEPPAQTSEPLSQRETDAETIQRLAALTPLDYDRARVEAAKALRVRPATLDKQISAYRKESETEQQHDIFPVAEPWHETINPAELLDEIAATIRRFIVCNPETSDAAALWVTMTWFIDVVQVAPLAVITAPEKRCGKSQLLFILGRLVNRPLTASNITPAALFRSIDLWTPTLLIDEADAFVKDNEELRGLLNCGHTRDSAYIIRTVGDTFTPTRFNAWGAKALAGIGSLADTLMDRAITLELRRKMPHETVDRLRYAEPELFETLTAKLARFADDHRATLRATRPHLPTALHDRAQDNWEPLLAIASLAGETWTNRATHAALRLSSSEGDNLSIGVELLSDIKELFDSNRADKISTADLITTLCDDDEKPWATYNRGKPINPRQIAKRLSEYGIKSKTIRIGYTTAKGFELDQFKESFARYLSVSPYLSVTTSQPTNGAASSVTDKKTYPSHQNLSVTTSQNVTDKTSRYFSGNEKVTDNSLNYNECYLVTFSGGETAKGFELDQFKESFARYLSVSPYLSVTTSQPTNGAASSVTDKKTYPSHQNLSVTTSQNVTDKTSRYFIENEKVTDNSLNYNECYLVTFSGGKTAKNHTPKTGNATEKPDPKANDDVEIF